jgi:hypothetical protein
MPIPHIEVQSSIVGTNLLDNRFPPSVVEAKSHSNIDVISFANCNCFGDSELCQHCIRNDGQPNPGHLSPQELPSAALAWKIVKTQVQFPQVSHLWPSMRRRPDIWPSPTSSSNLFGEMPMYMAASSRERPRRGMDRIWRVALHPAHRAWSGLGGRTNAG